MLVPRGEHPPCQLPVDRVPGHRGPVDVPYQHVAARAKCSVHLTERRRYVGDVLEDLNAERPLEAGVWDRERGRARFMEGDVVVSFGTLCGHGEHVRADVQTDDRALGPDGL